MQRRRTAIVGFDTSRRIVATLSENSASSYMRVRASTLLGQAMSDE